MNGQNTLTFFMHVRFHYDSFHTLAKTLVFNKSNQFFETSLLFQAHYKIIKFQPLEALIELQIVASV